MPRKLSLPAVGFLMLAGGTKAAAQEATTVRNEAHAEIGARLRSFYFNLAHNDWEALTADILAAKVVAHRPVPESLLLGSDTPATPLSLAERVCSRGQSTSIHDAVITVQGDWAEAVVPHCARGSRNDEFRLIRFAGRWRFIAIQLSQQPVNLTVER
jgi:hypothetical protein